MEIEILKVGQLETNCYLVIKDKKCLIIDPGADEDFILERIRTLQLEPIAILITHNHHDHIGSRDNIKDIYGIKVYDHNNLFEQKVFLKPFSFNVIYTPGHSSDSISFYFPEYDIMFTGDFIFKDDIGRVDLPTSSYEEMINSIKKVKEYDDDIIIYPGHGETTTLGYEIKNNEYFK